MRRCDERILPHKSNKRGDGMTRLIIVSNRVASPRETAAGGLAVGLLAALEAHGGLWFGWSGKTSQDPAEKPRVVTHGPLAVATIDLTREDITDYYEGYANSALWPLFHHRLDLANFQRSHFHAYMRVNALFAERLASFIGPEDIIWIHDYHLIPMAAELRARGIGNRIGFFLHIPWPAPDLYAALPHGARLARTMAAYDLLGFQTQHDLESFRDYMVQEGGAKIDAHGMIHAHGHTVQAQAFPIGVDTSAITALAPAAFAHEATQQLIESLQGRALAIGVDRLDYSKGLPERFLAIEQFLDSHPDWHRKVSFLQIAAPSRTGVAEYRAIRRRLESLAGRINGRYATVDWAPIRYLNSAARRARLVGFYRAARIGLVTPLRDGMNLVAKEYVAAQDRADPGVLILSRFAGAAEELGVGALLVNPYDSEATADAIARALAMEIDERRARHSAMMDILHRNSLDLWRDRFLDALTRRKIIAPTL